VGVCGRAGVSVCGCVYVSLYESAHEQNILEHMCARVSLTRVHMHDNSGIHAYTYMKRDSFI